MGDVRINSSKLQVVVGAMSTEAAYKAANRVALRARGSVLGQGRMLTLEMINGFRVTNVTYNARRPTFRVHNIAKHFPFQELGTGDPPGIGRIFPKNGPYLVFRIRGTGPLIFARSVRGVKPGHFLRRAAEATIAKDFT